MAQDGNDRDRKAAGRPDGGQFGKKTGQGPDDDPVPPEPSPDGADGAHMDRPGRMAGDDPEPDDAGRADFEKDVADDILDNLGGIADGAAMDGYGVGSKDPR